MWVRNNILPAGASVLVTDISKDLLAQSQNRIDNSRNVYKFETLDIQNINCPAGSFDKILANVMLYHCADIEAALDQVSKALKPCGYFYATTSGLDHLKELKEMVMEFDPRSIFPLNGENKKFCLENGENILSPFFEIIQCARFNNSLRINDIDFLYEFVASFNDDKEYDIISVIDNQSDFKRFLEHKMNNGCIEVTKSNCMFICGKRSLY